MNILALYGDHMNKYKVYRINISYNLLLYSNN